MRLRAKKNRQVGQLPESKVFSYYSSNRPEMPARGVRGSNERYRISLFKRIKTIRWRGVPSLLLGILIIFSLLYLFVLNPEARVSVIQTANFNYHTKSEYERSATAILKRSIFNRNKLTINTTNFKKQYKNEFPEVSDISLALPVMGHRPTVTVQLLPPAIVLTSASGSFVLDASGRAVLATAQAPAPLTQGLPVVVDATNPKLSEGQIVLPSTSISFIKEVARQMAVKKIAVQSYNLPALPAVQELQVHLGSPKYYIKFFLGGDARLQSGSYFALADSLKGITPHEYVDVRTEEKIYYK